MTRHPLLLLLLSACAEAESGQACIDVPEDAASCPAAADVDLADAFVPMNCDTLKVKGISGEGTLGDMPSQIQDSAVDLVCCYEADLRDTTPSADCDVGRPLGAIASLSGGGGCARAEAWAKAGLGEHASIAAFSRLMLELLAHGAPTSLVRAVIAAADDEVRHTEACFALAARFGSDARPGPLPIPAFDAARPLATIAAAAVREGCLVETLGAVGARAAADAATEADVRSALHTIADDEARHAALSWRVVAWAMRVGGAEVREAVRVAFTTPIARPDFGSLALRAGVDVAVLERAVEEGITSVIRPAAGALLAA